MRRQDRDQQRCGCAYAAWGGKPAFRRHSCPSLPEVYKISGCVREVGVVWLLLNIKILWEASYACNFVDGLICQTSHLQIPPYSTTIHGSVGKVILMKKTGFPCFVPEINGSCDVGCHISISTM